MHKIDIIAKNFSLYAKRMLTNLSTHRSNSKILLNPFYSIRKTVSSLIILSSELFSYLIFNCKN